jgi:hypothetical protein
MTETRKKDLSISMETASWLSLVVVLPILIPLTLVYIWRWGVQPLMDGAGGLLLFVAVLVVGIVIHELLHGLAWVIFGRKPFSSISFGFQLKTLTPFAHIREPLEVNAYRAGTLAPTIVLGFLPVLVGLLTGAGGPMFYGLLFIFAGGGDLLILWVIRGLPAGALVEDHPSRAGCLVIEG